MVINAHARHRTDRVVLPIARRLVRVGVTANWLTFAGLVANLLGVVVVLTVSPHLGAWVLGATATIDAFDGAVARLRGSVSPFGSFYDSVADRLSDAAVFGAALWLIRADPLLFVVGLVALTAALVTSYVRAKAESLGWNATVGVIERPERMFVLIPGIGFLGLLDATWPLGLALWVLAVGGVVTVVQRVAVVLKQAGRT